MNLKINKKVSEGSELRKFRKVFGISQARFSELSNISQQELSAFELNKSILSTKHLEKVNNILSNLDRYHSILSRRKRYRHHTYQNKLTDPSRARKCDVSAGNTEYVSHLREFDEHVVTSHTAVSLFAGIGGFSLGFARAGFGIKGFVEIDDELAAIYATNFQSTPRIGRDIVDLTDKELSDFAIDIGETDIVIGGPPCQGFSLSGNRDVDDPRNYLFNEYLRVIRCLSPKVAVMENVKLLTSMRTREGENVSKVLKEGFRDQGYEVQMFEVNAKNYGVPEHRERVFFVAIKKELGVMPSFPSPSHSEAADMFNQVPSIRTFADACSDLPYIESGESTDDIFHRAVRHPDHVIGWLWDVAEGTSAHENSDPKLRPTSGYNTTYKRQIWNEPAATVQTTFGMISGCRNVHPVATRSLTTREAARIQSFPDSFKFDGSLSTIRTGIGNAVPPILARAIGEHFRTVLTDLVEAT